ncbi:MAG: nucleotidyltransferase domain-containing protein [Candidatus Hatepunaea meridiana]|nr:nucleotidyltransferase domain-containing protein [Candidatus Hatepunaea meridiana]
MKKQELKNILNIITDKLRKDYHPEKIILYGSYAYGEPTEHSDIDLFIIKDTDKDWLDRFVEVKRLVYNRDRYIPISPLVYTPEEVKDRLEWGDAFIKEILKKGEVLYAA